MNKSGPYNVEVGKHKFVIINGNPALRIDGLKGYEFGVTLAGEDFDNVRRIQHSLKLSSCLQWFGTTKK